MAVWGGIVGIESDSCFHGKIDLKLLYWNLSSVRAHKTATVTQYSGLGLAPTPLIRKNLFTGEA